MPEPDIQIAPVTVAVGPHGTSLGMDVTKRTFLVGWDFSTGAENALWYTLERLANAGDTVVVLAVLEKIVLENLRARISKEANLQAVIQAEADDLAKRIKALENLAKVNVQIRYVPGDHAPTVFHDEATKFFPSMIVIGSHGAGITYQEKKMRHAWEIEKILHPVKTGILGNSATSLVGRYDWPVCVVPASWQRHSKGLTSLLRTSLSTVNVEKISV